MRWTRIVDFPRNLRWLVRNAWRYRKQLWRFRTWDWEHNYEFFFDTLRDTQDHIAADKHHERWQKDVREINVVLARWEQYQAALDQWDGEHATVNCLLDVEERAWNRMHRILECYARRWWD